MRFKKMLARLGMITVGTLAIAGCGKEPAKDTASAEVVDQSSATDSQDDEESIAKEDTDMNQNASKADEDAIAEAIRQETAEVDTTPAPATEDAKREPTAQIENSIPTKYISYQLTEPGTIESITYTAHDYFGDGAEIEKQANVYLPYGYDESKQYNILYLMHGIGGDENEWGMNGISSKVKLIMDNLIYNGDVEPFIVVTPNGRSSANHAAEGSDFNSFYCFGQELRNDLMPYMEAHYSLYSDSEDPTSVREHRAMAGLSMGGMQTINIGIGECVDLIGYFGAFSAAPTSNPAAETAKKLADSPYEIKYFYNICGTNDNIAYASASAAAKTLPSVCDKFVDGTNFMWQELPGGHDFNIWYLGFYNFAQLAFSK